MDPLCAEHSCRLDTCNSGEIRLAPALLTQHCETETSVAATVQLLGWESYAFNKRRQLDERGHLHGKIPK